MKSLLSQSRRQAGLSLMEVVVAMGVTVASLAGLSSSVNQATKIAKAGKAYASASQMIQERIEAFRHNTSWTSVTTAAGIAALVASPTTVAATFPGATETFTVQPYPSGSALVVTRSPAGTISYNSVTLPTGTLVKLTITATWARTATAQSTKQLSTLLAKGGL